MKLGISSIYMVTGGHDFSCPQGVEYSKNQAVAQSSRSYLCFMDSRSTELN